MGYWSAARQLVIGNNPYDQVALRTLQHQVRPDRIQLEGLVVSTWNPPWLLVFLLPLGLLPFDIAARLWILCNICIFGLASFVLWRMVNGPSDDRGAWLALLAGLLFGGSLLSIKMGQITGLVLVGLMACMWMLIKYSFPYYWFLWVPLVLLGLYLFALKQPKMEPKIVAQSP